mgnify:CR=1 FL=1
MTTIEQYINEWDTRICLFCEYVVQEKGDKDFREHLLKEHRDEIKEHFDLVKTD